MLSLSIRNRIEGGYIDMDYKAINNRNAGNSGYAYWVPPTRNTRNWCIKYSDGSYMRDAKGRVRRFMTQEGALKAGERVKV